MLIINMKCRHMYICQPSSMNVNDIRVIKVQMRTLCTQLLGTCFKNSRRDVAHVAKTQTLKIGLEMSHNEILANYRIEKYFTQCQCQWVNFFKAYVTSPEHLPSYL